jgi:D-alanyl-D-alanine carboxypeptidase
VQGRAGRLLAGISTVTNPAMKDGHQIYRARFTGFDATRATSTCNALRRQSVDCFVMAGD